MILFQGLLEFWGIGFRCEYLILLCFCLQILNDKMLKPNNEICLTLFSLRRGGGGRGGGGGVIFGRSKFKFTLFLNGLWDQPETLWLLLTFNRGYFAEEKKIQRNIKFSRGNIFLYRRCCQKIGVWICRNSFSRRIKYLHV